MCVGDGLEGHFASVVFPGTSLPKKKERVLCPGRKNIFLICRVSPLCVGMVQVGGLLLYYYYVIIGGSQSLETNFFQMFFPYILSDLGKISQKRSKTVNRSF